MPTVIYAVLIFAVLGFGISYVLVNGAKKEVLSENEQLENDAEFNKRIKLFKKLTEGNLIYGVFVFIFTRGRFMNGDFDMSVMGSVLIIFTALNFISEIAGGFIFSSEIKNYGLMENKSYSKALLQFLFSDLIAIAGLAYFLMKVAGVI